MPTFKELLLKLTHSVRSLWAWGLIAVLALAFVLRVWGIAFGLPQRTHVDEPAYVIAALKLASGNLRIDYPLFSPNIHQMVLAFKYGVLFVLGKLAGVYGSAAEFGQSYLVDPTPFYLLARLTSVVFSTLTVFTTFLLARKLVGRLGALVAALLLAVAFLDIRHAHFAEPYSLISFLALTSVYTGLLFAEGRLVRHLILSGGLAAAAFALRFSMAPVLLVPLLSAYFGTRVSSVTLSKWRLTWRFMVPMILGTAAGLFIAYPGIAITPELFLDGVRLYTKLAAQGQGFEGFVFNQGAGWSFYPRMFLSGLGFPMVLASLLGLVVMLAKRQLEWLVVFLFPVAYFIVIGVSNMAFVRYSVPLMPYVAMLAAVGIVEAVGTRFQAQKGWRALLLMIVCPVLVFLPLRNVVLHDALLTREDTRSVAKHWIEENIPAGSKIALQWFTPTLATESDPEPNSRRLYRAEMLHPFSAAPQLYSIDYYQDNDFDYLILSSFIYKLRRVDPEENAMRDAFYASLDQQMEIVAEFRPYADDNEPPFFFEQMWGPITDLARFERPGPTIKVYKLAPQTAK